MSTLGIDIGTTGCKVSAYSMCGVQLSFAYRSYDVVREQFGWCELPSKQIWEKVQSAICEVTSKAEAEPIQALCVSSMGEAMTPVDKDGNILDNCILSSDIRGKEYVDKLLKSINEDDFYNINPNIISPNYSYPKLAWMRDNKPAIYNKADKFLLWDGLVSRLLGGEDFASFSLANRTLLFDIKREDWSEELLGICDINKVKLPKCLPSGIVAGEVSATMSKKLGLPEGVKIVVGGHDQCLNALGSGIISSGKAAVGLGTYECITPVYSGLEQQEKLRKIGLNIEHYVVPGLYVSFMFNQGGSLLRWFNDTFASEIKHGNEELLQMEMPDDPSRLMVLPYFEPTGSPRYINDASGVIFGLKMDTKRGEILKAIMECTSFYFLEMWQKLHGEKLQSEIIASGGGAKSDKWLQIKADIFGVKVCRAGTTECGVLGAALLAAAAIDDKLTLVDSLKEKAAYYIKIGKTFEPNEGRHKIYSQRAEYYSELFPALQGKLSEWNEISQATI